MKDERLNFRDYKPLRDEVFQSLRHLIITGELKPGERLLEIQLSEKMGVSRTPIRESIRKLELEGLVTMLPRKGAHVSYITKQDIEDVLEIRAALDSLAARLAAKKATKEDLKLLKEIIDNSSNYNDMDVYTFIEKDVEFHEMLYKISGNIRLVEMSSKLREKIYIYRVKYLVETNCEKRIFDEHVEMYHAIKEGDAKLAETVAEQHIILQKDEMMKLIGK